jgi:hypothetical protein
MEQPGTTAYAANILHPVSLRDLFIRLAQAWLARAKWSDPIDEEWVRSIPKSKLHLADDRLPQARNLMNEALGLWVEELYAAQTLEKPAKTCSRRVRQPRPLPTAVPPTCPPARFTI